MSDATARHDERLTEIQAKRCQTHSCCRYPDFIGKPTTIPFLASKLRHWLPHLAWPQTEPVGAAPTPADAPDGVLDVAALNELTGGDVRLAAEVLDDFADESRSDLASLRAGYERGTRTSCDTKRTASTVRAG